MKTCLLLLLSLSAAEAAPSFVDLPTVMRLAGAKNEDVEHARTQHRTAVLESNQAWQRFWPTLNVGGQYRGHDGQIQDVGGAIFAADKQQYVVGAGVMVDWAPGDIYFGALAARQRALAAGQAVEKVRLDTVREATARYYDMLAADMRRRLPEANPCCWSTWKWWNRYWIWQSFRGSTSGSTKAAGSY
jgi:outer membrane protein TolC